MIITCEQCHARYLLASLLLGTSGRKVRCGVCAHEWYQAPGDEAYTREAADAASFHDMVAAADGAGDDIPEGVRPIPDGSNVPVIQKAGRGDSRLGRLGGGLVVAAGLFLAVGIGLVVFRGPVAQAFPPAGYAFDRMGLSMPVSGTGLVFDQVAAYAARDEAGNDTLTLNGYVVNQKSRLQNLPPVVVTLSDGAEVETEWRINLHRRKIDGDEKIPFTAVYEGVPRDAAEVRLRFMER